MLAEKSGLRRELMRLPDQMLQTRHSPVREQMDYLNQMLHGQYGHYGIAGNLRALKPVHRANETLLAKW